MKRIYLILIVCLLGSCKTETKTKTKTIDLLQKVDSSKQLTEKLTQTDYPLKKIVLPVIGSFELSETKIDSVHTRSIGDCEGTVRRYSLPNIALAIDSTFCGEYGFTYSYYLLNEKDSIQVVYSKKKTATYDPALHTFHHIKVEQVADFTLEPAILMKRIDTVTEFHMREKEIDKEFIKETLKDPQTTYKDFKRRYLSAWKSESDFY